MHGLDKIPTHTKRARPSGGVCRTHPVVQCSIAEKHPLHQGTIHRVTGNRQVGLTRLLGQEPGLGSLYASEHRRLPGGVLIHPAPEVDLRRIGIGLECLGQAENGIGRGRLHVFKHGESLASV